MAKRELVDACGVAWEEHRLWLPWRAAEFPRPKATRDPSVVSEFRLQWIGEPCWWCAGPTVGFEVHGEAHHMARHDRVWALAWLCAKCHRHTEKAVHVSSLPRLLWLKWKYDQPQTNWVLLAIGRGHFLPDPPTPESRA